MWSRGRGAKNIHTFVLFHVCPCAYCYLVKRANEIFTLNYRLVRDNGSVSVRALALGICLTSSLTN